MKEVALMSGSILNGQFLLPDYPHKELDDFDAKKN